VRKVDFEKKELSREFKVRLTGGKVREETHDLYLLADEEF